MKKISLSILIVCIVLSSLLLVSCSSAPSTPPTLTFTKEGCSYSGPKSVSPTFSLTRSVMDDSHESYAYVMGTLASGKKINDMVDWKSSDPPSWFTILHLDKIIEGNSTTAQDYNLTQNAAYQFEPVYIFCFLDDIKVGQVGPIKVKK